MVAELILRNSTSSSSSSSSFPPAKQSSQCSESSKSSKGLRPFNVALCHLAPPGERPKAGFVCFCFPFLCIICPGLPQLSLCLCFLVLGLQACTPSPSSKLFNNQNPLHMPSVLNTHSQNTNKAA